MPDFPDTRIVYLSALAYLMYSLYRAVAAYMRRPRIRKQDIVFQELFASVLRSPKWFMRANSNRGLVRLIVTGEFLIITAWPLFPLTDAFADVEHVIPLSTLEPVTIKRVGSERYMVLKYRDRENFHQALSVLPKDRHGFLNATGNREMVPVP